MLEFRQIVRAARDLRETAQRWKLMVDQYRRFPPWSSLTTLSSFVKPLTNTD